MGDPTVISVTPGDLGNGPATVTTALQVDTYRWEGLVFLELGYGDRWVRADMIAHLQRLPLDGPGDRTKVYLVNHGSLTVPESIEEIFEKLRAAMEKVGA